MSTLETNSIGKYSGNNVSIDDALNLKSYDTTGRDALTSVAGAEAKFFKFKAQSIATLLPLDVDMVFTFTLVIR